MSKLALVLIASVLVALAPACSSSSSCTPGQSIACACASGGSGAQVCLPNGTYGACSCVPGGALDLATPPGTPPADLATPPSSGPKRVFVTSLEYAPTAATSACQNAADAASLGGTWVAWLSFRGVQPINAIDTIKGTGPWKILDGSLAFANHAQLGTTPSVPIAVTEKGATLMSGSVWTATLTGGTVSDFDCQDFGDNTSTYTATVGDPMQTGTWTDFATASCSGQQHVYCFEQ